MSLPVRFSHLRAYGKSAAHGLYARQQDPVVTGAMQRGTAVHALLLGGRKVGAWDGPQRRGKEYEAFAAANPDMEILTQKEYGKASAMARAIQECALAKPFLEGDYEQTINFRWYGQQCRATPDIRGNKRVVEIKTSKTADPERFPWESLRMKYHAQIRMQQIATGDDAQEGYVIVVESEPPHPVTVFRVTDEALEAGEKSLVLWMERLITCEKSDSYPPYVSCIMPLDVPQQDDLEFNDEADETVDPLQEKHGLQI